MKTVKEILEAYNKDYTSKLDPRFGAKFPSEKEIPNVINLRRKAIRVFPDGQKIALYYSPQLDKYVSIPYGPGTQSSGIQVNEAKTPQFDDDVTDAEKAAYLANRKVSKSDIRSKMPIHQVARVSGAGAAAKEAIKRYRPGGGAFLAGQLTGIAAQGAVRGVAKGIGAAIRGAKKLVKEETPTENFKLRLEQIREARQYGKADAALDAASFLPGPAGSAASLASAGMSLSRGDYLGAALDVAGALPGVGYLAKGAKVAKTAKASKVLGAGLKSYKRSGSVSKAFSSANKQRKALKAAKGGKGKGLLGLATGAALGSALSGGGDSSGDSGGSESMYDYAKRRAKETTRFNEPQFGHIKPNVGGGATSSQDIYSQQQQFGGRRFTAAKAIQESSNFNKIKTIVENNLQFETIAFGDDTIKINNRIAKKVVNLYESLNKDNKKKIEMMLDEDVNSFKKIINFAIRQ